MDSEVFAKWFNIKMVKDRPILLLFDSHMTQIILPVIEKAMKERIITVKKSEKNPKKMSVSTKYF